MENKFRFPCTIISKIKINSWNIFGQFKQKNYVCWMILLPLLVFAIITTTQKLFCLFVRSSPKKTKNLFMVNVWHKKQKQHPKPNKNQSLFTFVTFSCYHVYFINKIFWNKTTTTKKTNNKNKTNNIHVQHVSKYRKTIRYKYNNNQSCAPKILNLPGYAWPRASIRRSLRPGAT